MVENKSRCRRCFIDVSALTFLSSATTSMKPRSRVALLWYLRYRTKDAFLVTCWVDDDQKEVIRIQKINHTTCMPVSHAAFSWLKFGSLFSWTRYAHYSILDSSLRYLTYSSCWEDWVWKNFREEEGPLHHSCDQCHRLSLFHHHVYTIWRQRLHNQG